MTAKTKKIISAISRWIVGLVFLFSSFVKGVDPLGTTYKIEDYMTAWSIGSFGFEWALPLAGILSMFLIVMEFVVAVMLLTNGFRRLTPWVLGLMMAFFTVTTLIDAITNDVADCGCFGDAVKLTNWQTFWKNVALDIPTIWLLLHIDKHSRRRTERDVLVSLFAILVMVIFGIYNIKNEPIIDFRPWKVGNEMVNHPKDGETLTIKSYLVYKNLATGEIKEFDNKDFMAFYQANPNFNEEWEFVDSRVEDPFEIKADGFSMLDMLGEDQASDLINGEEYLLIVTIHDIDKVDEAGRRAISTASQFAEENGIQIVVLSSALFEDIQSFLYANDFADLPYFFADATAIKTMMRSNPGFVLLHNTTVEGKWNQRSIYKIYATNIE